MTGWDLAGGLEDLHQFNYGEDMSWMTEGFGCRRKRAKETELFSRGGKRGRENAKGRGRGGGRESDGRESWEDDKRWEDDRRWADEKGWEPDAGWRRREGHGRMDMRHAYEREEYDRRDRRAGEWREDYDEGEASQQHSFSTSWPPAEEEAQQPKADQEKWQQDDWMTADIGWDNLGTIERSNDGMASGTGKGAGRGRHGDQRSAEVGRGRVRHHDGKAPGIGRHDEEYRGRSEKLRGERNDIPKRHDKPYGRDDRWDGSRDPKTDWSRGPEEGRGKDDGPNKSFYKGKGPDRDRPRDHERNRERERDRDRRRERDRDIDRSRERARSRDRDIDRSRERARSRDRDRDNNRSRARDRDRDGPSNRSREKSYERGGERERGDGSRKKSIEGKDGSAKGGRKLEWWEEEMPLTVEEKEAMFTCTLCDVKCGGAKNYNQHLNGVTHRMKAYVFPDEDPARYQEGELQEPEEKHQEEEQWVEEEELSLEDRMKLFYCALCEVQTTSDENLQMHNDGMRHRANIERQKKGEDVVKGSRNKGNRGKKKKITVTGEEVIEIQPIIDSCTQPLVGLEMIIEYLRQEWQTESNFYCTLCEARFQQINFMPHVTGYRHRYAYIKIKRPDAKDMCRVEPKEKENFKEVDGKTVKEIIPKRNRTGVLANLTKVCYEIQKEQGRQKMLKGPDPDPPEMPLNRLKKTMRADAQVELKALDPEEFNQPVSFPLPIPIGGVKRPAPKNKPKESVEKEKPTIIGYKPPDVPPPGMAAVPSDLPPGAPPPTAMMMRPGARPGMPPMKAKPLPPPPRPPPQRPGVTPQIGLPPKSLKMRELEEEMEKDLSLARSMMQEGDRRGQSSYMLEALEHEKEKILLDAQSLDIERLKERDRARLRERDPFLASYIEKGHAPKPVGGQERAFVHDRPHVSQDLKGLYEKDKASTSRSKSDEELKREYEERFGKKESSSTSTRVLAEVVGALSKSLAQSDEDASMALKVSSALTEALLSIKKKEEDSRTAVDFPNVESEGPPPPPPGDAEMPLLPSESPPTQSEPQQRYTVPPLGSYQQAQPVPQQAPLQIPPQQVPQTAPQPLGEWQPVNPPQSIPSGYPTPHQIQPQYQPGYPYTIPSAGWVPQPQLPTVPSYMPGVPMATAPHQYMPPYRQPEPPEIASEPAPPGESTSDIFSF